MTWTCKDGSDSGSVQVVLRGVDKLYSTYRRFATVLKDGTVVTKYPTSKDESIVTVVTWGTSTTVVILEACRQR